MTPASIHPHGHPWLCPLRPGPVSPDVPGGQSFLSPATCSLLRIHPREPKAGYPGFAMTAKDRHVRAQDPRVGSLWRDGIGPPLFYSECGGAATPGGPRRAGCSARNCPPGGARTGPPRPGFPGQLVHRLPGSTAVPVTRFSPPALPPAGVPRFLHGPEAGDCCLELEPCLTVIGEGELG